MSEPASSGTVLASSSATATVLSSAAPSPAASITPAVDRDRYPWLADADGRSPQAVEPLRARFAPPAGFTRREPPDGSFGAWLSRLPLAAKGTPVRAFDGKELHPADHPSIAAVVAIDVGAADLQQCADSVIRLHAEWSWATRPRDAIGYRAAAGIALPWSRWARGERVVPEGTKSIAWVPSAKPADDHATFRRYLDAVFAWANTVSLAKEATPIAERDLAAGDFVVLPGNPGHAVLVLDLASDDAGRRVALLGQGYMPAQSFQVLRPERGSREDVGGPWFLLEPAAEGVKTPFWPVFPWSALRRLPR